MPHPVGYLTDLTASLPSLPPITSAQWPVPFYLLCCLSTCCLLEAAGVWGGLGSGKSTAAALYTSVDIMLPCWRVRDLPLREPAAG
jgi:hypothetical protein